MKTSIAAAERGSVRPSDEGTGRIFARKPLPSSSRVSAGPLPFPTGAIDPIPRRRRRIGCRRRIHGEGGAADFSAPRRAGSIRIFVCERAPRRQTTQARMPGRVRIAAEVMRALFLVAINEDPRAMPVPGGRGPLMQERNLLRST